MTNFLTVRQQKMKTFTAMMRGLLILVVMGALTQSRTVLYAQDTLRNVKFSNQTQSKVRVSYLRHDGQLVEYLNLDPGEAKALQAYETHVFDQLAIVA